MKNKNKSGTQTDASTNVSKVTLTCDVPGCGPLWERTRRQSEAQGYRHWTPSQPLGVSLH